jgi:hypothetical protein
MRVAIVGTYPLDSIQIGERPIMLLGSWIGLYIQRRQVVSVPCL